jgi:hypothetical protein
MNRHAGWTQVHRRGVGFTLIERDCPPISFTRVFPDFLPITAELDLAVGGEAVFEGFGWSKIPVEGVDGGSTSMLAVQVG